MTTITYTVAGTGTTADGAIASINFVPYIPPTNLEPEAAIARAGNVVQKTAIRINETVQITPGGIPASSLLEWRRFFTSQMFSNDPFELDALDIPGIDAILDCHLDIQSFSPSRFGCTHYKQTLSAFVVRNVQYDYLLTVGATNTNTYGYNVPGGIQVTTGRVSFGFAATGNDMEIELAGYDNDGNELEVILNGNQSLGLMVNVNNNAYSTPEVFALPASSLRDGINTITVLQLQLPTYLWGVANITVRDA